MMTSSKVFNIEPNKDPFYGQASTGEPLIDEQTTAIEPQPSIPYSAPASGWICPVCGRGNAPFVAYCPCRPMDQNFTVTCTTEAPPSNFCGTTETRPLAETSMPNVVGETPKTANTCCNGNCACQ